MPVNREKTEFILSAKDRTKVAIKGAQKNFSQLDGIVGKLGVGFAGLAGAAGIGALITSQVRGAKQTLAYADALGVSTEALSAWQFAGESVGLEADKIADIMKDSAEKIGDAFRNNAGEAKEALESLNLSIEDMARLSPDQQLLQIANALDQVGTQGEKVQILESLGNDASLLLPLLEDNGAELQRLISLADETGATLTRIEADKLKEVDEATRELSAAFEGMKQSIVVNLADPLTRVIRLISQGIPDAIKFAEPAFDGIGGDILKVWEALNPSGVSGPTSLEDALMRQQKLQDDLNDPAKFKGRAAAQRANAEAELAQVTMVVNMLQKKSEILAENAERESMGAIRIEEGSQVQPQVRSAVDTELQKKLEKLRESLRSEEQAIFESMATRQQIINDAEAAGLDSIVSYDELRLQVAGEHEEKLTAIVMKGLNDRQRFQLMSAKEQTATVIAEMVNMTAGVAQHSKTLFKINKTAGIANALIGGYESFNKTMAAYPYPINVGLAGLSLAASLAQVDAIRRTSFNGSGGGSTPSAAGSVPTINDVPVTPLTQPQQAQGSQITINIGGNILGTEDGIRDIVVQAIEQADANDEIRILNNG